MKKSLLFVLILALLVSLTGCYSVFSGGTGGVIVDEESTSTPKQGIANVDIYAYTSEKDRDGDYSAWTEGTVFEPKAEYYGHTTTGADGNFTLSKLVWKTYKPTFGRDADVETIYLLFYHENYGLTKGDTVIVSDSATNTVYEELKKVRTSTSLNLRFVDVATGNATTENVYVKVSVPQKTETNNSVEDRVYEANITGTGVIEVSYPRDNTPEITIEYYQSADEITWKACANEDNEAKNYAFLEDDFKITKKIMNPSYNITLYGKKTKITSPTFSGQYSSDGSALGLPSDDGVVISAKIKGNGSTYSIDCGEVTTLAQNVGTNGTQKHGNFSGLANNVTWTDNEYTGKYASTSVKFYVNGTEKGAAMDIRSDNASYNVILN